jgi:squalene-hopene/tetraprenyl-beta-curcumene cyclase
MQLLSARAEGGYWTGELASSALSTATACVALLLIDSRRHHALISNSMRWLLEHQNDDGGWGDTTKSLSNISTTMLCRAALTLGKKTLADQCASAETIPVLSAERIELSLRRAEVWLERVCGGRKSESLARALRERYGKDRTFSVPILSCCALAGLISWDEIPALPFELACFPASAFRRLNLPVVSYALPALIALGLVVHKRGRAGNPVTRTLRRAAAPRALRKLESIQPGNGGFLEATPLVSFVTMSLAGAGEATHPVAAKGVAFLLGAVRPDGSWPIDTNLSTWVTTLAVNALRGDSAWIDGGAGLESSANEELSRWLLDQQYSQLHSLTSAAPGGWGWTPLPGAVPDADDTAGALIALHHLGVTKRARESALAGLRWLLDLQNRDGGWPTFCRGWGYLPFDRSSNDITAHVLRALHVWGAEFAAATTHNSGAVPSGKSEGYFDNARSSAAFSRRLQDSVRKGVRFLERSQRGDGSWSPLWFGNQHAPDDENLTYGTTRVLSAFRDLGMQHSAAARRGRCWLIDNQHESGCWGGAQGTPPSIEETALALEALIECDAGTADAPAGAVARGLHWLVERVEDGTYLEASPIGFYFAKLWYYEKLYPLIFTVGALGRAVRLAKAGEPVWNKLETSTGKIYV